VSAKITASRRNAFLHHLTNTGNIALSAERAKVSRSWVLLHRSEDPEFDEACREALAVAKMMLADDAASPLPPATGSNHPPDGPLPGAPAKGRGAGGRHPLNPKWRYHEGHELVVSGTNGRRTQVRRARLTQWSPNTEDRFLAVLSGTCNVRAACREAGMAISSAYAHRKRWPGFAHRWDQAIEIGMCELECRMIQNVGHYFDRELPEPDAPMQEITVMDAIRMLRMYGKRERGR